MAEKRKILIVSNQGEELQKLLFESLEFREYNLFFAGETDMLNLTKKIEERDPDLVIVDIMMPGMDGVSVSLGIRSYSKVPIWMLSTWGTKKKMVRGLDLTSEDSLTKPFSLDSLRVKIEQTFIREGL